MGPKRSTFIPTLFTILLFSTSTATISAFNITRLFDDHPDFSTFNDLLTKTGVATAINNEKTITVLALDNSAVGPIASQSPSSQTFMLAAHVILDYFDSTKLGDITESTRRTTLFQSSGKASNDQGFINITKHGNDIIFFSAVKGAPQNVKMVRQVAAKPYDIAVLQISQPIFVPGLNQTPMASPSPSSTPPKSSPMAPPPKATAPAPDAADAPADDTTADAPAANGPAAAPAPTPDLAPEDAPADDEPPAKLAPKNGGSRVMVGGGLVGVFMGFMALAL